MKNQTNKALRVGLFVFTALAIFITIIYLIGSKDNLFKTKTTITTSFNDIRGVVVGNNVRFSGINVGKVSDINVVSDKEVVLELSIVKEYARFIYKDALVEINQDGLMGSKLINITSGHSSAGMIEEGTHLKGKEGIDIENMLYEVHDILVEAGDAVASLKSIAGKIDSGEGDLAKLVNDDVLSTELTATTRQLNTTLATVEQITKNMTTGEGDIARLINSNELTSQAHQLLGNLNEAVEKTHRVAENLETTSRQINHGEGAVNLLLNNKNTAQNIDTTILKLQNSLNEFDKTARAVQNSWLIQLFSRKKLKDKKTTKDSIK